MKYKVGDKVKVKKSLRAGESYGMEDSFWEDVVVNDMLSLRGEIVTIAKVLSDGVGYFIDKDTYKWTDEMFEGLADESEPDWKVVIVSDGDTTLATMYEGDSVLKTATVRRYSEDKYSREVACSAVIDKLNRTLSRNEKLVKCRKYEVGDRVKIVDKWQPKSPHNSRGLQDKFLGTIMTIKKPFLGGYFMEEDVSESSGMGFVWSLCDIEGKVVPSPDVKSSDNGLKVGDVVEYVGDTLPIGIRGEIFDVDTNYNLYAVDFKFVYDETHTCDLAHEPLDAPTGFWCRVPELRKVY